MKFFIALALFMYSVHAETPYLSEELKPLTDEMVDAINARNFTWKAGTNFNGSTSIKINELIGPDGEPYKERVGQTIYYTKYDYPATFDARQVWPNCTSIGKVYDQKKGYPSWIYTAVGSVADRLCVQHGVQIDVESTVERMIRASGGFNTSLNSADLGQAFDYWMRNGIYTVKSQKESSCLKVGTECKTEKIKLDKYYQIKLENPVYCGDEKKDIMKNGPLASYITIYPDFFSYNSGVYQRSSLLSLGLHNVKLIGWGTENGVDYWLATNSWGEDWGENGLFKVKQCFKKDSRYWDGVPYAISAKFIESTLPDKAYSEGQLFDLA